MYLGYVCFSDPALAIQFYPVIHLKEPSFLYGVVETGKLPLN
jgi:hypothetical protein